MSNKKNLANNQENFEAPPLSYYINNKSPFSLFQKSDEGKNSQSKEIHLEMKIIKNLNKAVLIKLLKFFSKSCIIKTKNEKDYLNFLNKYIFKNNHINFEFQNEEKKENHNRIEINDNDAIKHEINSENPKKEILSMQLYHFKSKYYVYDNSCNNNYFYQQPIQHINQNVYIPKSMNLEKNKGICDNKKEQIKLKEDYIPINSKNYKNEKEEKKSEIIDNSFDLNLKSYLNSNKEVNNIDIELKKNKKKKKKKFVDLII